MIFADSLPDAKAFFAPLTLRVWQIFREGLR